MNSMKRKKNQQPSKERGVDRTKKNKNNGGAPSQRSLHCWLAHSNTYIHIKVCIWLHCFSFGLSVLKFQGIKGRRQGNSWQSLMEIRVEEERRDRGGQIRYHKRDTKIRRRLGRYKFHINRNGVYFCIEFLDRHLSLSFFFCFFWFGLFSFEEIDKQRNGRAMRWETKRRGNSWRTENKNT